MEVEVVGVGVLVEGRLGELGGSEVDVLVDEAKWLRQKN